MKILLNGVTASDIDLKGIPANKILKVEYYNIPPARYADAGVVVNVITKEAETGYGVGVEGRTAFTTGFTDDEVYYNFTSGANSCRIFIDGVEYAAPEVTFNYDFSQQHIMVVNNWMDSGTVKVENEITVVFSDDEDGKTQADGFKGLVFSGLE